MGPLVGRRPQQVRDRQTDKAFRESLGIEFIYESKGLWRVLEKGEKEKQGQRKRKE